MIQSQRCPKKIDGNYRSLRLSLFPSIQTPDVNPRRTMFDEAVSSSDAQSNYDNRVQGLAPGAVSSVFSSVSGFVFFLLVGGCVGR